MNFLNNYPYLYETHLHTLVASACAHNTPEEMVHACKEYGYTGIFVTDHNWGGNTCIDRELPWDEFVRQWCMSYNRAKAEGDKIGLDVFFGMETGFNGTEFLIYGIDEEWLLKHEDFKTHDIQKQYRLVHEDGGMVIHCHPYREENYIKEYRFFDEEIDGVEIFNACHSNSRSHSHFNPEYDQNAIKYAAGIGKATTAGSDIHSTDLFGAGVAFSHRLTDPKDYIDSVLNKKDYVLTNGEKWFDRFGNYIQNC